MHHKQSISLFFLFCLFNVFVAHKVRQNIVESPLIEFSTNENTEDKNEDLGINIFEEESKEGQEENRTGAESILKIVRGSTNGSLFNCLYSLIIESHQKLYLNNYSSIKITPLSPPPDQA